MLSPNKKTTYTGISLAIIATLIWSGNFIIARGVIKTIPPVSLSFYRWAIASIILFPFAVKQARAEWKTIRRSFNYIFWASLTGIAMFNTFVYVGAHYTTAINLALLGTTTSPIISVILARIFLKEQIGSYKLLGLLLCIAGVLLLLSKGDIQNLVHFRFTIGDAWILAAAASFAVYNTLAKKKPSGISGTSFLLVTFILGTLLLCPFYLWETAHSPSVKWDTNFWLVIIYLALGASVICFICWNIAVGKLGAGRTALFGNLIPVFSSIEAALILHEDFEWYHVVGMLIVFGGILLANARK